MQNPYQAPQSPSGAPQLTRAWHETPSVATDLRTVWGWIGASWGMLLGISAGLSLLTTLLTNLAMRYLPQFLGSISSTALAAVIGLVVSAAAIRVVLDQEDGRELGVGQALRFGFSYFGVLILPVALRYMFSMLGACLALPFFLVNGRLMAIEATFVLGVEDPSKTVFGGAWELGEGQTVSFTGTWTLLYLPQLVINFAAGIVGYALVNPEFPIWMSAAIYVPVGVLSGFFALVPALGGLARLLSLRHQAGLETEYRWRLMEDLEG